MTPPLHPFSITRRRLLMEMRAAVDAPPIGRTESLLGDALRFAYLCSTSGPVLEELQMSYPALKGESEVFLAAPLPLRLQILADRWADQMRITPAQEEDYINGFLAAMKKAYETEAIDASEAGGAAPVGE